MPPVTTVPTTQIVQSNGATVQVNNPVYQYKFQSFPLNAQSFPTDSSQGDAYLAAYPQTVRAPTDYKGPSNFAAANAVLSADNLMQRTWYSLVKSTTFNNFATTSTWGPAMEGVHGSIHVDVGGKYGHMTELSYSAFDPIFFLHHVNVDRLTALWQAMYPNSYLTPYVDKYGTYAIVPGSTDSLTTPLEPFSSNTQGTMYTSSTAQHMSTFGYSYPEIQDWNQSPTALKANVTAMINRVYNPNGSFTKRSRIEGRGTSVLLKEWSVEIQVSKGDLDGAAYIVRLFLGDVPSDPSTWATASTMVGSFAVLPPPKSVLAMVGSLGALSYDEVSLLNPLKAAGINDDSQVEAYLALNLQWRVQLVCFLPPFFSSFPSSIIDSYLLCSADQRHGRLVCSPPQPPDHRPGREHDCSLQHGGGAHIRRQGYASQHHARQARRTAISILKCWRLILLIILMFLMLSSF